jgi:transaldolase
MICDNYASSRDARQRVRVTTVAKRGRECAPARRRIEAPRDFGGETMAQTSANPLIQLLDFGQSVWLDFISRQALNSGDVRRLIDEDGLRGMTANPTIFQQAIASGSDYDATIERLVNGGSDSVAVYEGLAVEDIQAACDLFRPLYDRTDGADGFVSLEVAPSLALDTAGTIDEARRLWKWVHRPNLMIKVPGTDAGAPAVEQLLGEGLNINITLLFSLRNYERVAWAYVNALEQRVKAGKPIDRIASVASFFVSRVDTLVDQLIEERLKNLPNPSMRDTLERLRGKAAIANAKLAYQSFKKIFGDDRFRALAAKGARVQRPLWASTSVKNPAFPDLMYVESLIGPDTVDTMPRETIDAFRDHGQPRLSVEEGIQDAETTMKTLGELGIDFDAVAQQLEDEGVQKFAASFDDLIAGIEKKREALGGREAAVRGR